MRLIPDFKQLIPSEVKFTPATPGVNWTRIQTLVHGPGASDWEKENGRGDGNSAVFACLSTLAMSYPEPPVSVFRKEQEGKQTPLPDHPLQQLLDEPTPNNELTLDEMLWWTAWARAVDGNAYWLKVRSGNERTGNVVELWPLSPQVVEPYSENDEWLTGYIWQVTPHERVRVPAENIVHFRNGIDDRDHRIGLSALKRLLREIATDAEATRFTDTLLKNYAVPGLVVWPEDGSQILKDDAETMEEKMRRKYSTENRGKVAVFPKKVKVEQFGFSPEELNLQALHRLPEERISAVLGVPAIVAGLGAGLDRATYSNFREAREMFTERTLVPMWRADARKIATSLLPDFDNTGSIGVEFDITGVRALQEDEDKKYARLNIGVQGQRQWISVNEARTEIGLPPEPDGDGLQQQPTALPLFGRSQEDDESGEEEEPVEGENSRPFGSWTGKTIPSGVAEWKALLLQLDPDDDEAEQEIRMELERRAEQELTEALAKQRAALLPANVPPANAEMVAGQVTRTSGPVRDALRRALVDSADLGVAVALAQFETVGFAFDWTLANTAARDWANQYAGELITMINDTTRTQVQQAVSEWIENGDPLARLIEELTPTFGGQRASLIASTEVTRAYTEGNVAAYQESGVINRPPLKRPPGDTHPRCRCWLTLGENENGEWVYFWNTARDELVCPICGPLHGTEQ